MSKITIGVMGPGEQATATDLHNAYSLGRQIAQAGWVVLSGGRNVGVMDAVSRGAKSANGLTIGILPNRHAAVSEAVDICIITDMGNARNNINVLSSQAIVACGMGIGTASEVALALKAGKKVIFLTRDLASRQFFQQLAAANVLIAETVEEAITQLKHALASGC